MNKDSIWSKYNIRNFTCGKKLCRGNKTGLCVSCRNKKYPDDINELIKKFEDVVKN